MSEGFDCTWPMPVCAALVKIMEDKMVKTTGIPVKGFQFDASGKLKKKPPRMSVSKRIAVSKSKRVRVTRKTKGAQRP